MSSEPQVPFSDLPPVPGGEAWIGPLRSAGRARYAAVGLPHKRIEAWKYTDLRALGKIPFAPANDFPRVALPEADLLDVDAHRMVFVNGRFEPALSSDLEEGLPEGVHVISLASIVNEPPPWLPELLGALASGEGEGESMVALNAAQARDGFVLAMADGAELDKPLHVVFLSAAKADRPLMVVPRNLILMGAGAKATLIESHAGTGAEKVLVNGVTEVFLSDEAELGHYRLMNEALSTTSVFAADVEVQRGARYDNMCLTLGAGLVRNSLRVGLVGDHAACALNGAYAGDGTQHMDTTTTVEHVMPNTTSTQVHKGVLDGHAKGVYQGKVLVAREAQKTDGQQLHKALLLSRTAEVDCKPELEIYADDVKCAHGATAGEIDETQLFYLRARGLDEDAARALLVEAFLNDAVERLEAPVGDGEALKEAFRVRIRAWLAGRRKEEA